MKIAPQERLAPLTGANAWIGAQPGPASAAAVAVPVNLPAASVPSSVTSSFAAMNTVFSTNLPASATGVEAPGCTITALQSVISGVGNCEYSAF